MGSKLSGSFVLPLGKSPEPQRVHCPSRRDRSLRELKHDSRTLSAHCLVQERLTEGEGMLGTRVLKGTKWLLVPVSGGTGPQWPGPSWRRGRGWAGFPASRSGCSSCDFKGGPGAGAGWGRRQSLPGDEPPREDRAETPLRASPATFTVGKAFLRKAGAELIAI